MPQVLAARITVSEYATHGPAEADDILSREELIDGEIVPMPPPLYAHDEIKNILHELLNSYLASNPVGKSRIEMGFEIDGYDCLVPDVAFIRRERFQKPERYFQGAPDIAFEVISERLSHFESKLAAYFRGGASYVCSIHIDTCSVTVYSLHGVVQKSGEQTLQFPEVLPGFTLPVNHLFESL